MIWLADPFCGAGAQADTIARSPAETAIRAKDTVLFMNFLSQFFL
jgi:hypothetical protein